MLHKNNFKVSGIKSRYSYECLRNKALSGNSGQYVTISDRQSPRLTWHTHSGESVCNIYLTDNTVKYEIDNVGSFLVYFSHGKTETAHIEFRGDIQQLSYPYEFGVWVLVNQVLGIEIVDAEWSVSPYTGPIFSHQIDEMCD